MARFELKKSLEVTKLNKRTGIPVSGPPATIPFGALIEDVELDYDYGRFTYLGEPYRCASDVLKAAIDRGPAAAPAAGPPAVEASAPEPQGITWEQLRSNALPTARAKVPGGWLVAVAGSGVTFYPDPAHAWDGNSPD
jgi:hypothetical protein